MLIWWFALVSISGQAVFMEYRTEAACKIIQGAYARGHVKVTTCQHKEGTS